MADPNHVPTMGDDDMFQLRPEPSSLIKDGDIFDQWVGKAAHEIKTITILDGARAHVEAEGLADYLIAERYKLRDVDPRRYARQIFSRFDRLRAAKAA